MSWLLSKPYKAKNWTGTTSTKTSLNSWRHKKCVPTRARHMVTILLTPKCLRLIWSETWIIGRRPAGWYTISKVAVFTCKTTMMITHILTQLNCKLVSSLYRDHCYANESYWVTAAKILACEKNIVESIVRWYRSLGGGRVQWTGESACEARGVSLRSLWRGAVESFNLLKFHRKQIAAAGLDTYRFCRFTNSFSMRNDVEHRSK